MTTPSTTIRVFGIYLLLLAAVLVVVPDALLSLTGFPPARDVWVRVVGMLVGFLGFYYLQAARAGLMAFIRWTVPVRVSVLAFFGAFVALGLAPPVLLAFAGIDAAAAAWTWFALRNGARDALPSP